MSSRRIAQADRGIGDVERVEAQVADPGIDAVDDVPEPKRSTMLPMAPPSSSPSAIDR